MTTYQKDIHSDLIEECRKGDRSAQFSLYKLYSKAMYNTALRILQVEEEAEDVLQESFVKAFGSLHTFRGDAAFGSWLKRIVINQALIKLKGKRLGFVALEDWHEHSDEDENEVVATERLSVSQIKMAIDQLPNGYRTVLCLYLLEGYDHNEISEILGITVSTSKSQYKRAKDYLKKQLEQNEGAR